MQDTAEKIRRHPMDMTNMTFIGQGQNLTLTNKYHIYQVQNLTLTDMRFFYCAKIHKIICRLLTNENTGV